MLKIIKKDKGKFLIIEKNVIHSPIDLDFNPFVTKDSLQYGLIAHLRARPPQNPTHWSWGIYDVAQDEYYSLDSLDSEGVRFYTAQQETLLTKPTHVLIFPSCQIRLRKSLDGNTSGFIYQTSPPSKF